MSPTEKTKHDNESNGAPKGRYGHLLGNKWAIGQIKTPIGTYRPDWALIFKDDKRLYFVAETKSTLDLSKLRESERMKIRCGEKHFVEFGDVRFRQVKTVSDLLS